MYLGRPWVLVATLGIVTLVLYSGTLFFEFVWDDWPQIVNNPIIRAWSNLPRAYWIVALMLAVLAILYQRMSK